MTFIYLLGRLFFSNKSLLTRINSRPLQMLWYPNKDAVRLYGLDEDEFKLSTHAQLTRIEYYIIGINFVMHFDNPKCSTRVHKFIHDFERATFLQKGMIVNETGDLIEQTLPLDELFNWPTTTHGWQFTD